MSALVLFALGHWRAFAVAGAVLVLVTAGLVYREHLIDTGWDRALEAVKAQDVTAKEAASKAQKTVDGCYAAGGMWSTITGSCTLEAKP